MRLAFTLARAVGNTPLIKLRAASEVTGCTILGKAEFMNPGQSVKDRAALFIFNDAWAKGQLRSGGVIVEGTAGNTGIGLTMIGNVMGCRTIIVIPDNQSIEKKNALQLLGAQLVEVPVAPYSNPNNYVNYSGRLAAALAKTEPSGVIWANQFDNTANRQAHVETTAAEIWQQTQGMIHGFVSAVGTGGTLAGVAQGLREKNKDIKIALADPLIVAGQELGALVDAEALEIAFNLVQEEGLCLGASSGVNIAGAIRLAKQLGRGKTIVTVLCDLGTRYQSKMFNPQFLREKSLPVPKWLEQAQPIPPSVFVDAI